MPPQSPRIPEIARRNLVWTPRSLDNAEIEQAQLNELFQKNGFTINQNRPLTDESGRHLIEVIADNAGVGVTPTQAELDVFVRELTTRADAPHQFKRDIRVTTLNPGAEPNPSTTGGPSGEPTLPVGDCSTLNLVFNEDTDTKQWLNAALARAHAALPAPANPADCRRKVRVYVMDASPYGSRPELLVNRLADFTTLAVRNFANAVGQTIALDTDQNFSPNPNPGISHETSMASHGLFIASIIRMLAPQAEITIVPVMDADGKGSVEELVCELNRSIYNPPRGGPNQVLINFSATSWMDPLDPDDLDLLDKAQPGLTLTEAKNLIGSHFVDDLDWAFLHKFGENPNRRIIAAAGNQGNEWLPAFPARVKGVLSVGTACLKDKTTSPDSNACQVPIEARRSAALHAYLSDPIRVIKQPIDTDGIQVTLATRYVVDNAIAKETERINGLFVKGLFKPSVQGNTDVLNTCGLAHWAGTSFAAAVATGYMAYLCCEGLTAAEAYEEMLKLPKNPDGIPTLITWQTNV